MELHERRIPVAKAGLALNESLCKISEEYELTLGETLQLLLSEAQNCTKYIIRYERHGNYEKKGGEA